MTIKGVQTLMAQLLSETKVRTYHNTGTNYGQMPMGMAPPQMNYRPPMGMMPQVSTPHMGMGGGGMMGGMYAQPQQGYNRMVFYSYYVTD